MESRRKVLGKGVGAYLRAKTKGHLRGYVVKSFKIYPYIEEM